MLEGYLQVNGVNPDVFWEFLDKNCPFFGRLATDLSFCDSRSATILNEIKVLRHLLAFLQIPHPTFNFRDLSPSKNRL